MVEENHLRTTNTPVQQLFANVFVNIIDSIYLLFGKKAICIN